jgi:hypothetical protein
MFLLLCSSVRAEAFNFTNTPARKSERRARFGWFRLDHFGG